MAEYEGRHRVHQDANHERGGGTCSPPAQQRSGGFDGYGHSKSHYESHDYEQSSNSGDKEKERGREKDKSLLRDRDRRHDRDYDKDRDRERERDRPPRDHRDRSDTRERGRCRDWSGGNDHRGRRDFDRSGDHDREREGQRRQRSRSDSRTRSGHQSRACSHSRSESKRISGFDVAPPETALNPAAAAAAAGQFPGAATTVPGLPTLPVMAVQAMTQQATRHARRVYVGGLSPTANEQSVATFFSQVMAAIGGNTAGPGDAVVNVYINHEKKFAFVEMRSVEEASNAMALDGIIFEGASVKVRRPSDYNPSLAAALGPSQPSTNLNLAAVGLSLGPAGALEGPDRIFVGGVPYYFTESQIRELLETFGPLQGFDLVKDRETGNSKGYAFCVYQDTDATDIACATLNGIKMGDKTLTVRRANQGAAQPRPEQENVLLQAQQQIAMQRLLILQPGILPTKIVCLTQVVSADELKDDEEYEDIVEDMRNEGGKYGNLVNVVIPRPNANGDPTPGVGKVLLEYANTDGSSRAKMGLNGRKFGGNQVVAAYFPEDKYSQGNYDD